MAISREKENESGFHSRIFSNRIYPKAASKNATTKARIDAFVIPHVGYEPKTAITETRINRT
jgi:hypothetical protein